MTILLGQAGERICRGCGCTDDRACEGGCSWVLLDVDTPTGVCSRCACELEWDPRLLIAIGLEGEFPLSGSVIPHVPAAPRILLP